MAANKTIGGINVTITADISKFSKNITTARKLIGGMVSSVKGLVFNMKTLGAALATGAFAKLVANQFDAINSLKDLADKTGVSTDKLAGLQLAAEEAGIPMTLLEKSLTTLNNKMGMAGDQALRAWIDKTSKLATQQEKLAAATEMFGAKGASMVRFLNGGTAALDEAQKAAEAMGLAVSQDVAIGVDRASESFARFKMSVTGIFRSLAGEIAPFIELLSVKAQAFIASNGGGKGMGTFIADVIVEMAKNVVSLIQTMADSAVMAFTGLNEIITTFRSSPLGRSVGLGYRSTKERLFAQNEEIQARAKADKFLSQPRWSDSIQKFVDNARKESADQSAKWRAAQGATGILDGIISDAKSFGMGSLESWKGAGMGLWGKASGGFMDMAMKAGAMKPGVGAGKAPALSFAESGSVESYRQQAAIRRQGDQIAKKQLNVQEKMESHLADMKGLLSFPVANLGGG